VLESIELNNPVLYLASNSPRRRQLLALSGWDFIPRPADIDETPLDGEDPAAYVLRLAELKARKTASTVPAAGIVLAADTAVVSPQDGSNPEEILGKPRDTAEAAEMLHRLRGRLHRVYTAIAAMRSPDGEVLTDLCVSWVPMRSYTDEEIDAYTASGDPLDKAGAYAIQNQAFHPVEDFTGCTASVMGLPLCHTAHLLGRLGVFSGNGRALDCLTSHERCCLPDEIAQP
jgi:MAF protein